MVLGEALCDLMTRTFRGRKKRRRLDSPGICFLHSQTFTYFKQSFVMKYIPRPASKEESTKFPPSGQSPRHSLAY